MLGLWVALLLPWRCQGQQVAAPFVVASLEAIPSTAQACSELVFSGAKSQESRGEPLQYYWGFGPGTPSWFRIPLLGGILEEATAQSMSSITISPAILSRAGASLGDLREGEVRLEVRLTVRNDLGNSTETVASASIIGLTAQAEPAVSPVGATEITMRHSDELHLAVSTREASFALQCADRDPGASAGRTNVTWHYRSSNQLSWQSLDAAAATNQLLTDLARDPNKVHLAPLAFQPGTFHLFRAVAAFDMRPTLAPRPHVVFRVAVQPLPEVKVFITGPRLASQCAFELEAEVWDPVRPMATKEDFQFSWMCSSVVQVGEMDACAQLPQFAVDLGNTDGTGARGSNLKVVSGQLPGGIHRFSVIVRRASGGPQSIARKAVEVNASFFAPVRLQFPSYGYTGVVPITGGVPQVSAYLDLTSSECLAPDGVRWQWFLVEDRLMTVVDRSLSTSSELSNGLLYLQSGSGGEVAAGVPYFHVLLQANSQEMLDQVLNQSRPALDTLQAGVAIAAQSPRFVADQAPMGGAISVMPGLRGWSLRTSFHIATSQWQDEDLPGLQYEFLTFPFEAINHSAEHYGIDWEDSDSENFWMKLGGRRCRLFDRSPQASLQAPPGSHAIVVRARDVRGSISSLVHSMPLVVEGERNFTVGDATALLARVEVTNDVTQLLQAVYVISLIADPAVKIKTCSTDFFGSVTCDQIPSAEVVRPALTALTSAVPFVQSSDTLGKLSRAVEGMIRVAFEPFDQSVDVTAVFGDSLNPDAGNFTDDTLDRDPPETVFANVTRIQVLPEFLTSMASVLTVGQQQMLLHQATGASRGLEAFAAQEAWSAIVSLLSAVQGTPAADGRMLTQQVRALIDGLGALAFPLLPNGRELWLRTPLNLTVRADMMLAKVDDDSDIRLPGLMIPRQAISGRRLQGCSETEIQFTDWYTLNPHFAAPRGFGVTDFLLPNTSIKGLLLRRCGEPVFAQGLAQPLEVTLEIDQPQGIQPGFLVEHICAFFDDGLGAWSTTGMSSKTAVTNMSTQMTCQSSRGYGYFAALYRVMREVPPNTTTPPPPLEEDGGLGLVAIIAIAVGSAICLGGAIGGLYAWHLARSKKPVEPEEEEEEEVVEESETESEVKELPDPDPAMTKLRQAAEAGTLTAREILARHSGPTGIRQELVWALDKGYENKRRAAAKAKVKGFAQQAARQEELEKSDEDDSNRGGPTRVKAIKVKSKPR